MERKRKMDLLGTFQGKNGNKWNKHAERRLKEGKKRQEVLIIIRYSCDKNQNVL